MTPAFQTVLPKLLSAPPFFLIAGPCVLESLHSTLTTAEKLRQMSENLNLPIVFKASFDKANRQSSHSYRGPGLDQGLEMLDQVKQQFGQGKNGLLITTDCHEAHQASMVCQVADIIQIPALLCRQTDLIEAAAQTGCTVNIKKGPFASPNTMLLAAEKVKHIQHSMCTTKEPPFDNGTTVLLTERGTFFGYDDLVFDPRNAVRMRTPNTLVVQDVTHSVQSSGGGRDGHSSSGDRDLIPTIARAAVAVGVDGLFFETHENPDQAKCDGANQWPVDDLEELMKELIDIGTVTNGGRRRREEENDTALK